MHRTRRRSGTTLVDCKETTTVLKRNSRKCSYGMAAAGNYATAILAVFLLLGSSCHCLPLRNMEERAAAPFREKWWHNPCDISIFHIQKPDSSSEELIDNLKAMILQLKLTSLHFEKHELRDMYATVVDVLDKAYNYHWLPRKQLQWFKKNFQNMEVIQEQRPKVLLAFHLALQKYAVILNKLYHQHQTVTHHGEFGTKRRQILKGLLEQLKRVLCEAEKLRFAEDGVQPTELLSEADVIPPGKWDDRSDQTAVLTQDWGIFVEYKKFLDEITKIINELLRASEKLEDGSKKQRAVKGGKKGKGQRRQRSGSQEAGRSSENKSEGRRKNRRKNGGKRRAEGERREKKGRRQEKKQQEQ